MSDLSRKRSPLVGLSSSSPGFSFVEVVVAVALTTVVLGAVFSLLARGMQSTPTEMEKSDLQAQARHALERMSNDILLAGTDLPLEFPAFTPPGVNPDLKISNAGPDCIEIIGHLKQDVSGSEPTRVLSFDGQTVLLETVPTNIERGTLVLIYDDEPTYGTWMFGIVSAVQQWPQPALTVVTAPGAAIDDVQLPPFIHKYNRKQPASGFVTPITVVSYMVGDTSANQSFKSLKNSVATETVLWRRVNWGPAVQVAFVEDLQIRFYVGGTIPDADLSIHKRGATPPPPPPDTGAALEEQEVRRAPQPQPSPSERAQLDGLVRGVRIQVTTRSHEANLEGSTRLKGQGKKEDGYLRATYSTRVAARNILFKLNARQNLEGFN